MDEEMGEEEEEASKAKVAGVEAETGPPLLTPLSEDASLEAVPAWSVRASSDLVEEHAIAIVRSNLWPGAYCFTTQGKMFENIYVGEYIFCKIKENMFSNQLQVTNAITYLRSILPRANYKQLQPKDWGLRCEFYSYWEFRGNLIMELLLAMFSTRLMIVNSNNLRMLVGVTFIK